MDNSMLMEKVEQSKEDTAEDKLEIDEIKAQIKPLSGNKFVAFFQKIWRKWLAIWYGFSDKHPKASKLIYQIVFLVLFSQAVTIFQYVVTLFLPYMFGLELAGMEFIIPKIPMYTIDGVQKYWSIFGYGVAYKNGAVAIGGGLGYFLAFEIATFLAQCINFPLQRNITFKSHGNAVWQAVWYFIGWILISVFCNAINSLWMPLGDKYLPFAVKNILTIISTGGISMAIFFFIFLIIFPDYNAVEKRSKAKLDKLKKCGVSAKRIAAAEFKYADAVTKARLSNAEKAESKAITQASAKAMTYFATVKNAEKNKDKIDYNGSEKVQKAYDEALLAIEAKANAIQDRADTIKQLSE